MTLSVLDIAVLYIDEHPATKDSGFLDSLAMDFVNKKDYSFHNGLLGFGWLVGFLIDNKYIEGNADVILEDVDDIIYKLTIRDVLDTNIKVSQLLFYITYYQQRIQYNSCLHFYRRFTHIECLKLLITRVNDYLNGRFKISEKDIDIQSDVLLKYSYLIGTCINETLIEEPFYASIERLLSFYETQGVEQLHLDPFIKLSIAVKQYGHPVWEKRLKKLIEVNGDPQSIQNAFVAILNSEKWDIDCIMKIQYLNKSNIEFLFHGLTNLKAFD